MDGLSSKLSIYDFFNALFTGIIFILCFNFSIHDIIHMVNDYFSEENFGQAAPIYMSVAFVLTCYIIGILIQGLFELIYNRLPCGHRKSIRRIFVKKEPKFKCCKTKKKNLIDNEAKFIVYKSKAEKLFKEKNLYQYWNSKTKNDDTMNTPTEENLCQYFFAYCIYYLQAKEKNQKTERMRDVAAIAGMISTCFFALFFFNICGFLLNSIFVLTFTIYSSWIYIAVFAVLAILFFLISKTQTANRIRMVLGLYDVCTDLE